MQRPCRWMLFITLLALARHAFAVEENRYVVKAGDNLSSILYSLGIVPLYGKKGSVLHVAVLNRDRLAGVPDRLRPGDILILSRAETSSTERPVNSSPNRNPAADVTPLTVSEATSPQPEKHSPVTLGTRIDFTYSELRATQLSNGSNAFLESTLSPGWTGWLGANWSDTVSGKIELGVDRPSYAEPATRVLNGKNSNLTHAEVDLLFGREPFAFEIGAGVHQRHLVEAISLQEVKLAILNATELSLSPRLTLKNDRGGAILFKPYALYSGEASDGTATTKAGWNTYGGRVSYRQSFFRNHIELGFDWSRNRTSTNLIEQILIQRGVSILWEIHFAEGEK